MNDTNKDAGAAGPIVQYEKIGVLYGEVMGEGSRVAPPPPGPYSTVWCQWTAPDDPRDEEDYFGPFGGIPARMDGHLNWNVYSPVGQAFQRDALAGKYSRPSADAAAALGLGDNVLIGGVGGKFVLQPLSPSELSNGITSLDLDARL